MTNSIDYKGILSDVDAMRHRAMAMMYEDTWQNVRKWMSFIDECWKFERKLRKEGRL